MTVSVHYLAVELARPQSYFVFCYMGKNSQLFWSNSNSAGVKKNKILIEITCVVYTDVYFATACKRQKCVYFAILEFERQIQSHFVQSSSSLLHQKGFTYRFDSNLKAWWIGYMSGVLGLSVSYLSNVNICQVYDDLTEWIELSARNFPVLRDAAVESQFRRLAERLRKSHPSRTYFVTSYVEWGHSFLLNGTICLREGRTKEVPGILKKSLLLKELFWVLSLEELHL